MWGSVRGAFRRGIPVRGLPWRVAAALLAGRRGPAGAEAGGAGTAGRPGPARAAAGDRDLVVAGDRGASPGLARAGGPLRPAGLPGRLCERQTRTRSVPEGGGAAGG